MRNGETKGGASAPRAPNPGRSRGMLLDPIGCSWIPWDAHHGPGAPKTCQGGRVHLIQGLILALILGSASTARHRLPSRCQLLPRSLPALPKTPPSVREKRKISFSTSALPGGGVTEREHAEEETSE